jgi:aminomethyltransferase
MLSIAPSARLRPSPFYEATIAEGMTAASIYNSMILPTSYGDPEAEYWRLVEGVSQWDVGAERQVQLKGPDAGELAQLLSPRDLSHCWIGQGKYIPLCDHRGTLINDPILLKVADDRYWFSIADSDIWLWAKAIAAERKMDVEISDPGVSPMALQGPKAADVVAHVCGDWVRDLKYFWFAESRIDDIPIAVQRSGWSKKGGFEIYLLDKTRGSDLWAIFKEAGQPYGIGPGSPNTAERTESGLVSLGGDTDDLTNPYEVRLGKYVDLEVSDDIVGIQALRRIAEEGPTRHLLGIVLEGNEPDPFGFFWEGIWLNGERVGSLTNCVWSPRMKANIGYALVSRNAQIGDDVIVQRPTGDMAGKLVDLPFI